MGLLESSPTMWTLIAIAGAAAVASATTTRLHIAVARAVGLVAPRDMWHDEPVAQSGGIALWVVLAGATALLGLTGDPTVAAVLAAGVALAVLGFVDDRRPLQPNAKLIVQLAVSVALVMSVPHAAAAHLHLSLAAPIAFVWLVGQSNAINLLDNMDGMCPALLGVTAAGVAVVQAVWGFWAMAAVNATIAGASLGFLVWNRRPARVFLGDTGSLSLGLVVAFGAMHGSWIGPGASLARLPIPVLLVVVPLLNTLLVIVTRYDAGVPVSRGLADHANYRLVAHGFAMRRSIEILCLVALLGAVLAWLYFAVPWVVWMALVALFGLALAYFAVFLSQADVEAMYVRLKVTRSDPPASLYRRERRRAFEILSDATVASASCFLSFQLRFEGELAPVQQSNLVLSLPVVILAAIVAQWACGSYRVFWKYIGVTEAVSIAKSSAITGLALLLATRLSAFRQFPRSMYVLFPMVFFLLATGYRVSLRMMHEWRRSQARPDNPAQRIQRVLIVGAGDAGELALRDLRNAAGDLWSACGFLDDDPEKLGLRIHGVAVLATTAALVPVAEKLGVRQVVLAMPSAPAEKRSSILRVCEERGIAVHVFEASLVSIRPPVDGGTPVTLPL
jgi:UDP-GlcNAc:undecaprenyl-phosphate GlcNAc-1-phosphate transferase